MWDWAQDAAILLILLGLIPFNLVDRQHVGLVVDHVPGGRPTMTLLVFLILVTVVALRLTYEQLAREDWEVRAARLREKILTAVALENRYAALFANDRVTPPPTEQEIEQFTRSLLEWLADFVDWAMASATYLRSEWGAPHASRFEMLVMPVSPDVAQNPDLQVKARDAQLYRNAVTARREYLDKLMGQIEDKLGPR